MLNTVPNAKSSLRAANETKYGTRL
jgi:hypothetical protein